MIMIFMRIFSALVCYFTITVATYAQMPEFKELRSDHFIIQYFPATETGVYKIKDDAEYFYRKITQEFGLTGGNLWAWENRVKILVAKDRQEYLSNFQCPGWSAACVDYSNRIIYTYPAQDNFSYILSHELTHIIFREYIGYRKLPLWLDEGMATHIEYRGSYQEQTIATLMKQLIKDNKYLDFTGIDSVFSLSENRDTQLFYNQAFSMVYFLIKRFGNEDFSEFLSYLKSGSSVEDALRRAFSGIENIKSFEEAWKKFYLL